MFGGLFVVLTGQLRIVAPTRGAGTVQSAVDTGGVVYAMGQLGIRGLITLADMVQVNNTASSVVNGRFTHCHSLGIGFAGRRTVIGVNVHYEARTSNHGLFEVEIDI